MKALAAILIIVCISHVDMFENFFEDGDYNSEFELIPWKPYDEYDNEPLQNGDFYFVDSDLKLHVIHINDAVDEQYIANYTSDRNNIRYYLYTRSNPLKPQRIYPESVESVNNSNFDSKKQTVFIVPEWTENYKGKVNTKLRKAFLRNIDVNVICVDWSYKAKEINYKTAKNITPKAGIIVGEFIKWLMDHKFVTYRNLHLVGFSLGAHLVGSAGRKNNGKIARITGLDPAGPLWTYDPKRLNKNDAQYVEVIHTNIMSSNWPFSRYGPGLGIKEPSGHADFYPNGGHYQPRCNIETNYFGCAHYFSVKLMCSSIKYDEFKADKCDDLVGVKHGFCFGPPGYMGHTQLRKNIRGIFRLMTGEKYPYCIPE